MSISRVERTKGQARASYDRMSRWYDALSGGSEWKHTEECLRRLAVRQGERVLEIGPGTGHALTALARAAGQAYGLDLSPGMIRVAQSRAGKAGLAERVALTCGDGARLPFDGSFDAVLMSFTLELFDTPEIPHVLDECRRVLGEEGRIGVVALSKGGGGGMVRLYEWAHRAFPRAVDCRPIFVQEALQGAGFQILDSVEQRMWGLPVEIVVGQKQGGRTGCPIANGAGSAAPPAPPARGD